MLRWIVHRRTNSRSSLLQNTDPFVFGESFLYTCCQQFKNNRPTQLRYLAPGSVILFGSHRGGRFLLDTVFVTRRSRDHCRRTIPQWWRR